MTASPSFNIKKDKSLTQEPNIASAFEKPQISKIQRRSLDLNKGFFGQFKNKPLVVKEPHMFHGGN